MPALSSDPLVYTKFSNLIGQLRPYLPENTRSRSIPEVKLVRALLVLRFVRTWESRGAVVFLIISGRIFCRFFTFVLKSQGNWMGLSLPRVSEQSNVGVMQYNIIRIPKKLL